jgi:hypothetical protein
MIYSLTAQVSLKRTLWKAWHGEKKTAVEKEKGGGKDY